MSYTAEDARVEFEGYIDYALKTRDIEAAYIIRDQFAREGDDEQAEYWNTLARKWDDDEWAYDRNKDNTL